MLVTTEQNACAILSLMYTDTCGERGLHWYGHGEMCACGQVPKRLLAAPLCDCGGSRLKPPEHEPDCRAVNWALERNAWADAHPDVEPPLATVPDRAIARGAE